MACQPRFVLPGHPQHVIQRGNNRSVIFGAEEDYGFYLDKLREGCKKHGCDVHAYVLMTNHTHLLLTPHSENGIGKLMQFIGRCSNATSMIERSGFWGTTGSDRA